ncbi:hypothetical protein MJL30_40050, partial [Salmonella enterica subsp. enterica serovar Anatum]|nr:hypothetical protein [Salmonella enterica subsp. enterica serovar Anatum]
AIQDVPILNSDKIICSRLKRDDTLMVPSPGTIIQAGDLLHLVVQSFLLSPPLFSLIGGIFACKILAVLASSGSGAPGGVFTPT